MLCKAGQLLSNLCCRLGNREINEAIYPGSQVNQSHKPARTQFSWFSVSHPRYHLGGGICVQLRSTETEQALVMKQPPQAQRRLQAQHNPDPCFQSCWPITFTGNHVCSHPSEPQPSSSSTSPGESEHTEVSGQCMSLSRSRAWPVRGSDSPRASPWAGGLPKSRHRGPGRAAAGSWDRLVVPGTGCHRAPMWQEGWAWQPQLPCMPPAARAVAGAGTPSSWQALSQSQALTLNAAGNCRLSGWQELP